MQPKSPNPDFDFMLKNRQASKKRLPLPSLNLPKPVKIVLAAVAGLLILVVILSLLSGRGNANSKNMISVLARCQETLRVTAVAQQLTFRDPQTQALAATVTDVFSSENAQLSKYLSGNHISASAGQLAVDKNPAIDSSFQSASQNNSLDATYVSYLKNALGLYETDLQTAYKTSGPNGKIILNNAFDSAKTLLNSPPLKS